MLHWGAVLLGLTCVRLLVAAAVPLAPDEAYYWIWSRAPAAGYLDHPPMVALWIAAGTFLAGDTLLGVRLLGPISAAVGALLLADAAERLIPNRKAGLFAAAGLSATLLLGVGSVIMTPDTPLLFFWIATIWALARIATGGDARWWPVVGVFAGAALASKYTAAFLWGGIFLWLVVSPPMRRWLRHPMPWFGALLGMAVFAPVIVWNHAHGWVGFLRQGGRVADWQPGRAIGFLGELIGGQAGLVTPGLYVLCLAGIVLATRRMIVSRDPVWTLLCLLTLPASLLFLQHAIGDRVQGNWPAIVYPAAIVAAAERLPRWLERWRRPSIGLGFALTALAYVQASTFALPVPVRLDPIALRLSGWDGLAQQIEAERLRAGADFVVAEQYALAAELAWHLPPATTVLAAESRWSLFSLPLGDRKGAVGLLVTGARADPPDPALWPTARPSGQGARGGIEGFRFFTTVLPAEHVAVAELPRPRR